MGIEPRAFHMLDSTAKPYPQSLTVYKCVCFLIFSSSTESSLAFFPQSIQFGPLFSQIQVMWLKRKKKKSHLGEFPKPSKLSEKEERLFLMVPGTTVPAILDLCIPSGLGLHQKAEDGGFGVWQEGWTAPDNQALMRGGRPRTSPRSGVRAGEDGEQPGLPCAFKLSIGLDL